MDRRPKVSLKRTVFTHGCTRNGHEPATHEALARRLAALLGLEFGGDCGDAGIDRDAYLIPRNSLAGPNAASRYRIAGEGDLLGGWVPEPYMATKAIMHPLVSPQAASPPNWPGELTFAARDITLSGFTAFSSADAITAGRLLLAKGSVRLKPVYGKGGRGQTVVADTRELESAISRFRAEGVIGGGLVLERNLLDVTTYSVGQLRLPDFTVSYCGTQFLTTDNRGRLAYGGSELTVVPGGYDDLHGQILPCEMVRAIDYAERFDRLADRHLPGLIASRRNYDVVCGSAEDGTKCMGVLEQSWRVGGATGAELVAVEALARNARARAARTRAVEIYGNGQMPPDGALVCFRGEDPLVGPLLKYAYVEEIIAR